MSRHESVTAAGGLLAILILLLVPVARATDLPPAAEVLDRYVETTGGKAAYEKIHDRTGTGTFGMPAMGITGQLTLHQAAPDLYHMQVELPGMGTIETGYDGETAWELNPMTGARILEGEEKAATVREAVFNAELKWRDLYDAVQTTGRDTVGDRTAWVVALTPPVGSVETRYYDTETGLLLKMERTQTTQMGEVPISITLSDYETFDGIEMPTRTRQDISVQTMVLQLDDIQQNTGLGSEVFALPPAVQALQKAAPAAGD